MWFQAGLSARSTASGALRGEALGDTSKGPFGNRSTELLKSSREDEQQTRISQTSTQRGGRRGRGQAGEHGSGAQTASCHPCRCRSAWRSGVPRAGMGEAKSNTLDGTARPSQPQNPERGCSQRLFHIKLMQRIQTPISVWTVEGSVPSRMAGDHAAGTWLGCCHVGGPGTTWHGSEVGRGQSREHPHPGQMDKARGETLWEKRRPRGPSDCPRATVAAQPRLQDLSSSPTPSLVDLTQEVSVGRGQREPQKTAPSPGDEALGRSDGCGPPTQSGCYGGALKQMVLSPPQKTAASLRSLGNWPWRSWTAAPAQTGGPRAGEVTCPVGPCAAAGTERDTGESWRRPSPGGTVDWMGAQAMGLRQCRGAPPAVSTPCGGVRAGANAAQGGRVVRPPRGCRGQQAVAGQRPWGCRMWRQGQ
ncbi:uncharacterized protein LOC119864194 isoform X1 [Canis lupus familiaris]|uniref:uncharacterized protein LOC119864194 isoform X1 n=1 Tax=Canis lupus familiaris TaxID=9615 RepID=UPI0018F2D190|nr:uncharacterized protein LOC119864194 isoform X1 [Canis lupus familiaris]XP_038279923.1 uncharacterized protein LOC119864194 isoform X1 [Canis lupus familiaris]XP_038310141.1 uncharacterized protein LOC119864194 isoform X1 [Canis lupus familiaris]XP_038310142.1 uncharacterized protein LOC119864194 isoform X1 [Canis lupus familiaris]XP_038418843.1 uncharacterized protein LOC119864194 isoform X1 [Canis lupus familiaris]XP_038418844.1 uncharacterized protein LOC119864194 isoform X1 [Canis lupus